ncbi:MAG: DUF1592 domain-containing protein, partial [Myxococcales bacterium]|nr:DUF1592 domain-containing protein [Myxococcales bacterium]
MMRLALTFALLAAGALAACEEGPPPESGSPAGGAGPQAEPPPPFAPSPAALTRLTRAQYGNLVRDLFGPQVVVPARLEPDVQQAGFSSVGAARTAISPRGVEQYEAAAFDVAEQALTPEQRGWLPCTPSGAADRACAEQVLAPLARRAWRRPVTPDEVAGLLGLFDEAAAALGDFHGALVFPVARVLQSPHFLFRSELGEPDPERPGQRRYTSLEMASRLAFFLWNSGPDEALLAAGEAGELLSDAGLEAQAERLLGEPRAQAALRNFFVEHLGLSRLEEATKDPTVFVHASADLAPAAKEETLRLIDHVVFEQDVDFRTLLTTRTTFIDRRLAALYGVPAGAPDGFAEVVLPADGPRVGLLGHASVLMANAHATASSATRRGSFIRKALLCDVIPPPPADVDTTLPEPEEGLLTLRERLAEHAANPTCAGCHAIMDPIGLGLEQFDGVGRFRTTENGGVIDPSGELDG